MRNLSEPINDFDLINGVYTRTQPSMHTEYLIINHYAQCEEVEHISEVMPDIRVAVFPRTLGVEAVGLGDAARFMVPADEMNTRRVSEFKADEERDRFDGEEAAVNVVA